MKNDIKCVVERERRLCMVGNEYGYFHTWEQHSRIISKLLNDGKNIGTIGSVFGIVELENRVIRVDPEHIVFCDGESEYLKDLNNRAKTEEDDLK